MVLEMDTKYLYNTIVGGPGKVLMGLQKFALPKVCYSITRGYVVYSII